MKFLSIIILSVSLLACGTSINDKNIAYRIRQPIKPLEFPLNLIKNTIKPNQHNAWSDYNRINSLDNADKVLPDSNKVNFVRKDDKIWLVVAKTPTALWGDLKQFLIEISGINSLEEDKFSGLLSIYSINNKDKIVLRLEKSAETTRIYAAYYAKPAKLSPKSKLWIRNSINAELEAEILSRLMSYLGASKQQAKQIKITEVERATLIIDNQGTSKITLKESFVSTWRRLNNAINDLDIKIVDLNRSAGVINIAYADPENSNNSIFSSDSELNQYFINVKSNKSEPTTITIENENKVPDTSEAAQRLMKIIHQQLK